jgi:superfamily I DNA/RNA helicase
LVLYDDAQSIYHNTAEVLRIAHKFAADVLQPESADEDGVPLLEPHAAGRHGPEPRLLKFAALRDEAAYLAQVFAELHEDGHAWADMAVIYRSQFIEVQISAAFERAGLPTVTLTRRRRDAGARPDAVHLVTFHSSKGLEYRVVGIPG